MFYLGSCKLKGSVYLFFFLVFSIKRCPQPPEADGDKDQRTVTINSCHMGKAFKVMNELRRYFFRFNLPLSAIIKHLLAGVGGI